jgi:ribosomal protein S18 acetylase RimI-like enzyme
MKQQVRYEFGAVLDEEALDTLFRSAWGAPKSGYGRVLARSFGWVTAMSGDDLIGFVNVGWDGGAHLFLLDTTVHPDWRRKGIGRRLVEEVIKSCHGKGEWLHVDAPEELMRRLYRRTGFEPIAAGIINIQGRHRRAVSGSSLHGPNARDTDER